MTQRHDARAARAHLGGETRRTVLPGGLRVISESVPGSATFSLGFFVDTGSRHEQGELHGAAHFLEHVLFKGTRRRTAEEISIAIESVGGDINAYTGKEQTCFYAKVLAEDAELAVDVIADMLSDSLISSTDVEAERAVILDEIAMHNDDPSDVAHELVSRRLFGDGGLGLPVIGTQGSIAAMTAEQVTGYFHHHYGPASIVVSAAGRVDHDRLSASLASFRAGDPTPTGPTPSGTIGQPADRDVDGPALLLSSRPLEQVTAVLGLPGVGLFDLRRHSLGLLSIILGGGMSSRLFVQVRERRGLTYGIEAGETCYSDDGLWTVEWQSHPGRVGDILDLVRAELADVVEHGVSDAELVRAKGQLRGQTLLAYEGPSARMSRLGSAELTGDSRTVAELLRASDEVTSADCQAVAVELFTADPVLALVGPDLGRTARRQVDAWIG